MSFKGNDGTSHFFFILATFYLRRGCRDVQLRDRDALMRFFAVWERYAPIAENVRDTAISTYFTPTKARASTTGS